MKAVACMPRERESKTLIPGEFKLMSLSQVEFISIIILREFFSTKLSFCLHGLFQANRPINFITSYRN